MKFWEYILSFFIIREKPKEEKKIDSYNYDFLASNNNYDGYTFTADNKKIKNPEYAIDWLPTLRELATFNNDVSLAVKNLVDLASQDYTIYFSDVSKIQEKKMRLFIEEGKKKWYPYSLGITSLINDLLRQLAVYGCICADVVLESNLKSIKQIALVNPYNIRFGSDENGSYKPYQKLNYLQNLQTQYKELDTFTFKYITLQRDSENPYPIPPFLSALEGLGIQRDMLENLKKIIQKLGLFGFLSVNVKQPEKLPNESPQAYLTRCNQFLDKEAERILKLKNRDVGVGFKDVYEFAMQGSSVDGKNAKEIMSVIDTVLMSGLKQDPAMVGREKNTSEAFGRVLLAVMTTQITTYQKIVASFLESVYLLGLQLEGYKVNSSNISVEFREPIISDELKKEQTQEIKIRNLITLRNEGILNQYQVASELGYDAPASEVPIVSTNTQLLKKKILDSALDLYNIPSNYPTEPQTKYSNAILKKYKSATKAILKKIIASIKTEGTLTLAQLQDKIYANVVLYWQSEFIEKSQTTINTHVTRNYTQARKDKRIFPTQAQSNAIAFDDEIPDAVFTLLDYRTIDFLKLMDSFYLGKFVTEDSFKTRLYEYIRLNYIESDTPIGQNEEALEAIRNAFPELMDLEAYKITRIINTSVNRMRSFGNISYLSQAKVEKYRIVEVLDRITCPHCRVMNGKEFSVSNSLKRIESLINSSPEEVKNQFPFATTIPINEFENLTTEEIEALNISLPAFHPNCRGRCVAVID